MLVHVVDCATLEPGRDPISDIEALEAELAAYTPTLQGDSTLGDLAERPRAVVLNKIDVPEARELADFVREEVARRFGWPVFEVSTVSREGLRPLTFALWDMVAAIPRRAARRGAAAPGDPADPVDESGFTVESDGEWRLRRARRPAANAGSAQTDFTNDEAVGYLGDRLARLGVEDELLRLGAKAGLRGHHRRHDVRLGAADPGGRRRADVRPRHRHPAGTDRPGAAPTNARRRRESGAVRERASRERARTGRRSAPPAASSSRSAPPR